MPTLSESLVKEEGGVPKGFEPVAPPATPIAHFPPNDPMAPVVTGITRCPLPPIFSQAPDNLRNWYNGGKYPQRRIFPQQLKGN